MSPSASTAVTILDIGRVDRCLRHQILRIDEDMPLLALDPLAGVETGRIRYSAPFSALFTLRLSVIAAVGLTTCLCPTQDVEPMVRAVECSVMLPAAEIVIHGGAQRKVFPDLPCIHCPLAASTPAAGIRGDQRPPRIDSIILFES